ncbi:MAG TPA: hypothetical protein VGF18_08975 [Candidatus Tumulicola sp.]
MLFAIVYRPGERWDHQKSAFEQDGISAHRDFLGARFADGTLMLGGPFLDDCGGIGVYKVDSREQLVALIATDTTISSNLMTYELHPCALPFAVVDLG